MADSEKTNTITYPIACTKVVRISRDGSFPDVVYYKNVRPAECTLEEFLMPAVEYLADIFKDIQRGKGKSCHMRTIK